ncbi:MAG: tRNA (guanosine(37)-N1)-methyltransferase TrmD [Candidatus Magasanikbacteria bacterium RIFCSPHIGHO2_02_FULL_47_14]|uniref:tRNA (guanine-N(1)-)-methyltransferase n=1 Tax=Candidatus Magasanikbacteria bacterium RIFCSPHIGHO2_02_FULL_47_14 TaxID=1798680 RepID=A0A1F6MA97_9BACT|nr:MAG: tRNA (guanosine(37)-N1)-methyltransferase TrmD [Candidatus Magasanikbacteria bacterium RIFCSPHIGHO2_02_FULL_47_14]
MRFQILSVFPNLVTQYCAATILQRAQQTGKIIVQATDIRDFSTDKHKTVDDTPYGGGPGMVMKPEPIYKALESIDALPFSAISGLKKVQRIVTGKVVQKRKRVVLLSPRGRQFDQRVAEEWGKLDELVLICGRYEGIDQRVVDHLVDEEISVGPYVLAGGELGALIIIEAIARLIPGVLGNPDSLVEETHSSLEKEYPHYTKPAEFHGWKVPDVLLSGDHKKIEEWRKKQPG